MNKYLSYAFVVSVCAVFSSCASQNYYIEKSLDANNKTMNVPRGYGSYFVGPVKDGLKEQGWKFFTYDGRTMEKVSDSKTIEYDGRGRYTLSVDVEKVDTSILDLQPIIDVSASIADNITGEEIMGFSANYSNRNTCVKKFLKLIKENTK